LEATLNRQRSILLPISLIPDHHIFSAIKLTIGIMYTNLIGTNTS
jgi:hypothetical protein